ncbi:Serine/threonine-protein phosphatase 4 regulatory subunit 2 [Diplonema papillatum]|nr:Serine/threonine-protein phosphatase 4 regulatory subunit 2 [Diplonema papillatum]
MATEEERKKHEAALSAFAASPVPANLSPDTLDVLRFVGETGCNCYPWSSLQSLLQARLEQLLPEDVESLKDTDYATDRTTALEALPQFPDAPFTLQRLCEVLVDDTGCYQRKDKLVWALLKLLCINSTIATQPFPYESAGEPPTENAAPSAFPVETQMAMPAPTAPADAPEPEKEQQAATEQTAA